MDDRTFLALSVLLNHRAGDRILELRQEIEILRNERDAALVRENSPTPEFVVYDVRKTVVPYSETPLSAADPERVALSAKVFDDHPDGALALSLRREIESLKLERASALNRAFAKEYGEYGAPEKAYLTSAVKKLWKRRGREGFEEAARRHGVTVACIEPELNPGWCFERGRRMHTADVALVIILGPHLVCGGNVHVGPRLWTEAGWNSDKKNLPALVAEGISEPYEFMSSFE